MNRYLWIFIACSFVLFGTASCKTSGKTDQGLQESSKDAMTVAEPQLADGMFARIVTPTQAKGISGMHSCKTWSSATLAAAHPTIEISPQFQRRCCS